jgi:hypothetical protein
MLSFVWPGGLPGGTYRFFMLATRPGALADGRLDPGDTVVAGILDAGYVP